MCASFYLNFCVFLEFTALLQKKPKHFSAKKMITYGMLFHLFFTISLLLRDYLKKKKKITCDRLLCLSSWSEQDSVFKLHLNIEELAMEDCSITGGSFWSLCETI